MLRARRGPRWAGGEAVKQWLFPSAAALAALWPSWAGACEACRNMLAEDPEAAGFSKGIYLSIVVMLGMVFAVAALFIWAIVKEARRNPGPQGGPPRT